jgi:Zn-dependent protease with chaperone function
MSSFQANLFDGQTSQAHQVTVQIQSQSLEITGVGIVLHSKWQDIRIEPVLGRTIRVLTLRSGEKLETTDFAAITNLEQLMGVNKGMNIVHRLEQSWRLVLLCFAGLIVATFGFVRFGVPWIATQAAYATPVSVLIVISDSAIKSVDQQFLRKSKLSDARMAELQAMFARAKNQIGQNYPYKLLLRSSDVIGANAFALPSGSIVMTDQLVALAKNDLEIEAVVAHEIGHVIHRHGIRNLYQSLGLVLLAGVFIGDFSSVAGLGSSLPVLLLQNGYSQEFELQSDQVAGKYLMDKTGSTKAMRDMLMRLEDSRPEKSATEQQIQDIFRTHPITPERIRQLEKLEVK